MKKHLLLLFTAAMTSLSSFALEVGEYVYTPQGRFKITGEANEFGGTIGSSFDGFSVVSAEEKSIADLFTAGSDDVVGTYFQTLSTAANTDGMAYKMVLDPGETYVVSFKAKSSSVMGIHDVACTEMNVNPVGMNKIAIYSTGQGEGASGTVVDNYSKDNMITTEWTTFCYAISNVDGAKDYYIEFLGLNSGIEIADIQIKKAFQVIDNRKQEYYAKLVDAYLGLKEWSETEEGETGLEENLETLKSYDENTNINELDETIGSLQEGINTIITKKYLDNWLGVEVANTFGAQSIGNKSSSVGIWSFTPSGRAHSSAYFGSTDKYVECPHYSANTAWDRKVSAYTTKYQNLPPGKFVFSIELTGAVRKTLTKNGKNSCWDLDEGLDLFQAKLYLVNEAGDTIAKSEEYPISASEFTPNFMTFELTEFGNYKVGIDVSGRPDLVYTGNYGGTVAFKDAKLLYKSNIAYTKTELDYIAAVQKEIKAGRDNITAAQAGLIDDYTPWGRAELQACLDSTVAKIEAYETYDTIQIVNTIRGYDGEWVDSETDAAGLLQNEIYLAAVRDLVAANKRFNLVNDSLNLLTNAIAVAKELSTERTYATSVEAEQLQKAIASAEETLATLRTSEYSDENRQTIENAIAALEVSKTTFMNAIPAEAIETLVDIDFSGEVTYGDETADYNAAPNPVTIKGNLGSMEIGSFMTTTPANDQKGSSGDYTMCSTIPYELGIDNNGAKIMGDVLRVGASSAVVPFDAGDYGTNILRVSMDWWFLRLSGSYVGFKLQDEENNDVTGLVFDTNTSDAYNYNPMSISGWNIGSSFAANTSDNDGAYTDGNKTHIALYLDYGTKKVKLTSQTQAGSYDSGWKDFNGNEVKAFVVTATTKAFNGRRSWFDNLKIEKITAGAAALLGDANGDGQVTMADANAIVNYFLAEDKSTIDNFDVTAADANNDGQITMADANAAVNIFLGSAE